jgi:preprotein translocase subunit YajC
MQRLLASLAFPYLPQETAPATAPATEQPPSGSLLNMLVPMAVIIGIFYFIVILPERKKQKQRNAMLGAMKKGDKVMTSGGIYGQIAAIQDDVVTLQVDEGVRMRFARASIQSVVTQDEPRTEKKD